MEQTPEQQIESIVRSLEEKGTPAAPVMEATALATTHPDAVSDLAVAVIHRFPKGGTFLDGALSYLPSEKWSEIIPIALDALVDRRKNEAAESVIEYASFQCPSALHPHLDRIFSLRPNEHAYYEFYPWRESGNQHFDFLRRVIEDASFNRDDRTRAWRAFLQTRHMPSIEYAITKANSLVPSEWSCDAWVKAHLHLIGIHKEGKSLKKICPESLYHLQFPNVFFEPNTRPPWLAHIHPTWHLENAFQPVQFGGISTGRCLLCNEVLHRQIVFEPIPNGLGVTKLDRLELSTCLSCLGWERQPLFYQHAADGTVVNIGYDGPTITPQFPVGPLRTAVIDLAPTPRRWFWQDWACNNSRENLNRIGGEACWIQDAEYPNCPSCNHLMPFLFQLDSDLPTANDGEWLWGSGGIVYGFWCDSCKVSALLWQCT